MIIQAAVTQTDFKKFKKRWFAIFKQPTSWTNETMALKFFIYTTHITKSLMFWRIIELEKID